MIVDSYILTALVHHNLVTLVQINLNKPTIFR